MSEQGDASAEGAKFALQRIYVKDISFESPKAPDCFRGQWKPKINLTEGIKKTIRWYKESKLFSK